MLFDQTKLLSCIKVNKPVKFWSGVYAIDFSALALLRECCSTARAIEYTMP